MDTPLNASSTTAGALLSGGTFLVPQFQREYAWEKEEIEEFFRDLSQALQENTYFLGLIIVTGEGQTKDVVDGQQRLLTLTLLAAALYHEAVRFERKALAERLQSTFLKSINFDTDAEIPRLTLSSPADDATLQRILAAPATELARYGDSDETVSDHLVNAYRVISEHLLRDLAPDAFRRLGTWAEFITNKIYFAIFVHPDPSSAYRVFEIINTRGKELTTADLLKSYVLSQTSQSGREARYDDWQRLARAISEVGSTTFVQFIRHAVTVERGHILPRDLYDVLTGRSRDVGDGISPDALLSLLSDALPAYVQMADPSQDGNASVDQLRIFAVLNALNIVSVRPILLAMDTTPNPTEGMRELLRLVVRRVVVGTLGTGNVERRFGQVAQRIRSDGSWERAMQSLADLQPSQAEFRERLLNRSLNRNVLAIVRSSVLQRTITPELVGHIYFIKPRNGDWSLEDEDRASYWVSTIGNSFLATEPRRPSGSSSWSGFKLALLPKAVEGEWTAQLEEFVDWDVNSIAMVGEEISEAAAGVWYDN